MQNRNVFINHSNIALSVFDKLKKLIKTHSAMPKIFKSGFQLRYPTEKTHHIPERVDKEIYIESADPRATGRRYDVHTIGIFPNDHRTIALRVDATFKLDLDISSSESNEILNSLFSTCTQELDINLKPEFYHYSDNYSTYRLIKCCYGHNLVTINKMTLENLDYAQKYSINNSSQPARLEIKMRDELTYQTFEQFCSVANIAPCMHAMLDIIDNKHNAGDDISSFILPSSMGSHQV